MSRKKKEALDIVEETLAAEGLEEADDVAELDLVEEEEAEQAAEAPVAEEEPAAKPKRKRSPRRNTRLKTEDSTPREEVEPTADLPEVAALAEKPIAEPVVEVVREEIKPTPVVPVAAAVPIKSSVEPEVRSWESIRAISDGICTNLERINAQLLEMPAQYTAAFQESFRVPTARPAPITKVAVLVAGLALILSVLSLSFAQSVRQGVLSKDLSAENNGAWKKKVAAEEDAFMRQEAPPAKAMPPAPEIARAESRAVKNEIAKSEALTSLAKKRKVGKKRHS